MSLFKDPLNNEALIAISKSLIGFYKAEISIYAPRKSNTDYDFASGSYVSDSQGDVIVDHARARIQRVRASSQREVSGNDTEVRPIFIALPAEYNPTQIPVGARVVVHDTDMATDLINNEFFVQDYANNTNPLERGLFCTMNLEVRNV